MKNIVLFFAFISSQVCFAQNFERKIYPARGKQIILDIQEASIAVSGYNGNDLIIESDTSHTAEKVFTLGDALKALVGTKDTSHLSPVIVKENAEMISVKVPESGYKYLRIKVPQNAHLQLNFLITSPYGIVSLNNLAGELEIGGTVQVIKLDHISGPLTLSPGHHGGYSGAAQKIVLSNILWKDDIVHTDKKVSTPGSKTNNNISKVPAENSLSVTPDGSIAVSVPRINIITNLADVDISLPEDLKATVQINTMFGELYSDLNIVEVKQPYPPVKGKFTGKVNGGLLGTSININTTYGNIYLRKEK